MPAAEAYQIIAAIKADISNAADALLDAAEKALADVRHARAGQAQALDHAEAQLCSVLEACAFQDLVGQRLGQLERIIGDDAAQPTPPSDPLLNGPAQPGAGLSQAAVDILIDRTMSGGPDEGC